MNNTRTIDHVAEAQADLEGAEDWISLDELALADFCVKSAQAHATLALVEQQRIANEQMQEVIHHALASR